MSVVILYCAAKVALASCNVVTASDVTLIGSDLPPRTCLVLAFQFRVSLMGERVRVGCVRTLGA